MSDEIDLFKLADGECDELDAVTLEVVVPPELLQETNRREELEELSDKDCIVRDVYRYVTEANVDWEEAFVILARNMVDRHTHLQHSLKDFTNTTFKSSFPIIINK